MYRSAHTYAILFYRILANHLHSKTGLVADRLLKARTGPIFLILGNFFLRIDSFSSHKKGGGGEGDLPKSEFSTFIPPGGGFRTTPPEIGDHADDLTFMYDVYFENFGFGKGGILPGVYGGEDSYRAFSCSGGSNPPSCFSLR